MDEDVKELTKLLAAKIKPETESKITVGWTVIIGIFVASLTFLLNGYIGNARSITKLDSEICSIRESVRELTKIQAERDALIMNMRIDIQRGKKINGD